MVIQGIDNKKINRISKLFKEDKNILDLRIQSIEEFKNASKPIFGPDMKIDYDKLQYYNDDNTKYEYKDIPKNIKSKFKKYNITNDNLIIQSNYKNIYENKVDNIICCSFNEAYNKHNKLFNQYFNKLIKYNENIFTLLNNSIYTNSLFIYIPEKTTITKPLTKLLSISEDNLAIINKIIIVVDEGSNIKIINDLISSGKCAYSLLVQTIEVFVKKKSKCVFISNQDLSNNINYVSIKRAQVEEHSNMIWIENNIGSLNTMSYPTSILNGKYASSKIICNTCSKDKKVLDTGARVLHQAPNTKSEIICNNLIINSSDINNRYMSRISTASINSTSIIKNTTYLFDNNSRCNIIPRIIVRNNSSNIDSKTKYISSNKDIDEVYNKICNKYI